ncbi:MAG TPA: phosphoribosylglycinamide synthetase C domain-containing protein, partial [Chitinophagaceae bacterium]
ETDLVGICIAATQQELDKVVMRTDKRAAATIMAVSRGYPTGYEKGFEISGLNGKYGKQSLIFHAGTKEEENKILTNGGRVFCVTSLGKNIEEAVNTSLDVLDNLHFEGINYRTDIGYEFIPRTTKEV